MTIWLPISYNMFPSHQKYLQYLLGEENPGYFRADSLKHIRRSLAVDIRQKSGQRMPRRIAIRYGLGGVLLELDPFTRPRKRVFRISGLNHHHQPVLTHCRRKTSDRTPLSPLHPSILIHPPTESVQKPGRWLSWVLA